MKILQTISGMSAKSGGPSTCTMDLLDGLYAIGANTDLLTVKCANPQERNLGEGSPWLKEVENDNRTPFVISANARKFLRDSDYDLYHCNALWMGMNHDTCRTARDKKKPYIISPHGMLYPTALKVHSWKKKILLGLWYKKDIFSADCLHTTCKEEMEHCRAFGYKGPIAVIPNCMVFDEDSYLATSKPVGKKRIGSLGRLHPIKKVERVLYALALLTEEERAQLSFLIMGKFDEEYEDFLKAEVKRLALENCVTFKGFVSGKEKYDNLRSLSALLVPSEQENFGMIVPEALVCGTPVYASLGTPWEELNIHQCGWWRDNSPETIAEVLREILATPQSQLLEMGTRGRRMIEENYEQKKAAAMMRDLYQWIINKGEKPEFVYE